MKKPNALANALRNSGSTVAASPETPEFVAPLSARTKALSRMTTKAITVHFPEDVRRQLKSMAAEQGRSMEDMVGEGLNLLFARYRRPELAPRKNSN